jgi:hypothetical protein
VTNNKWQRNVKELGQDAIRTHRSERDAHDSLKTFGSINIPKKETKINQTNWIRWNNNRRDHRNNRYEYAIKSSKSLQSHKTTLALPVIRVMQKMKMKIEKDQVFV